MKKLWRTAALVLTFACLLGSTITTHAEAYLPPYGSMGFGVSRTINVSDSISVAGGSNKSHFFQLSNPFGTAHNAFDVVVSDVPNGSKYTILILADGAQMYSKQFTGKMSESFQNLENGIYELSIINNTSTTLNCHWSITSYIG